MKLYDLAGADNDLRFSPNCWRIKMALEHKGLVAETVPWHFVEKDAIAFSGQKAVPVLVDGDTSLIAGRLQDTSKAPIRTGRLCLADRRAKDWRCS